MKINKLPSFNTKRRQRQIVNGQEVLTSVQVIIHHNPAVPPRHRMLR